MYEISLAKKAVSDLDKKYYRVKLIEEKTGKKIVELADGSKELYLGIGKFAQVNRRNWRLIVRTVVQTAKEHKLDLVVWEVAPALFSKLEPYGREWFYRTLSENLVLADYEFTAYKSKTKTTKKTKENKETSEIVISGLETVEEKTAFATGLVVGEYVNKARDISNLSASDMTPEALGQAAKDFVKGTKATVKVLGKKELEKLKMGALLAVGSGTRLDTKLVIVEYWGAGKPIAKSKNSEKLKPIVLVGKGVTYDTGGLNVKPSGAMHEMHMDMSGGASVLATIALVARLGLKKNIVALVPSAENAISDTAMRAGDVVTAYNGKTIEILHTDAEGRLILADALAYSETYNPAVILDVATLTGAALVALGQNASVIMTKNRSLQDRLEKLGEESGDLVWPLPLWKEYREHLKSYRADVSNISTSFSRWGGVIEGGTFLSFFAPKKVLWAHIDIAPRMESIPSDKLAKGSMGEPVRLLTTFIEKYQLEK